MRLDGPQSPKVEDRRGRVGLGRGMAVGGGIGRMLLLVVALLLGVDPAMRGGGGLAPPATQQQAAPRDDAGRHFVAQVPGETEQVWAAEFARNGARYEPPVLVLFSGGVQSGCGYGQAQMGPFDCPAGRRVDIDLDCLGELQRRLRAGGDFAAACSVAHEVGHHAQRLTGVLDRVEAMRRGASREPGSALQVRVGPQADCLAGLWARHAQEQRRILGQGDIEEGLNAAAAVGDDRLQGAGGGRVQPETFTHGNSEQRVRWFRRGLETGRLAACDSFGAAAL
jgi:predicted metalloprotease